MAHRYFASVRTAAATAACTLLLSGIVGAQAVPSADLTGKWAFHIAEAQVDMDVELTQTGTKLSGVANSDHLGAMKLEGTFDHGELRFVTTGSVNGEDVRIEYAGKVRKDGGLAGDLTSQMGPMTWTAERVKTHSFN